MQTIRTIIRTIAKKSWISVGLVSLVAIMLSVRLLASQSLWMDEVLSIYIPLDWNRMVTMLYHQEANMWFYMFLMHFWLSLGTSEFIVRSFSAIFAILSIPALYALAKKLFDRSIALTAVFLMSINFFFIYHAQLARSYSLELFISLVMSNMFVRAIDHGKQRYWLGFTLFAVLTIYTHLFGGLLVAAHYLSALFTKKQKIIRSAIMSGAATVLCLLPLVSSPALRSNVYDWFPRPHISGLPGAYVGLAGDNLYLFCVYGALIGYALIKSNPLRFTVRLKRVPWNMIFVGVCLFFPPVTAFLFSSFVKPVYQSIYFLFCLPAFLMAVSVCMRSIKSKMALVILFTLIISLSGLRLHAWYEKSMAFSWILGNENENWRDASAYIMQRTNPTDGIMFYSYSGRLPFDWYAYHSINTDTWDRVPQPIEISSENYSVYPGSLLPDPDRHLVQNAYRTHDRLWLVLNNDTPEYENESKTAGVIRKKKIILDTLQNSYPHRSSKTFSKVTVLLFTK